MCKRLGGYLFKYFSLAFCSFRFPYSRDVALTYFDSNRFGTICQKFDDVRLAVIVSNDKGPIPRLRINISIRIAYADKISNKLNNIRAILVVRISIRINFVRIGVRIESLSEPFYADDIRTAFRKVRKQKDINVKIFF